MYIRDRIKELRRVRARDLAPNPKNWRTHPKQQQDALRAILGELGYAGAVLTRETEDGRLMIIDGHLRAETTPDTEIPVLVTDLTEDEADKLLTVLDPVAALAGTDKKKLGDLLENQKWDNPAIDYLLKKLEKNAEMSDEEAKVDDPVYPIVPQLSEKYDYVVIFATNEVDLAWLHTALQIQKTSSYKGTEKIGLGRVISAKRFAQLWQSRS